MEPLEFREIASLVSLSRTTVIDEQPSQRGAGWSIYPGRIQVQGWNHRFQVLYLTSSCTAEQVKDARAAAAIGSGHLDNHVVFAPSLDNRHRKHRELQGVDVKGVWNTRDYLRSFIADELTTYRKRLHEEEPQYYIEPKIETPSGFVKKTPNPLESLLLQRDNPRVDNPTGIPGVLLADPGQGKTYSTRYLATRLSQRANVVPIYINSSQWRTMSIADMASFSKTLTHCFRHFGSSIGWLDGHEDEFVRVTLKAGVFAVIFDGFDEYVLWNRGEVDASEVLDTVRQLARDTGASILITSRTSYWEASVPDFAAGDDHDVNIFTLMPFDINHAKNYFEKRLQNRAVTATQIFRGVKNLNDRFTGRGFILSLIADLAERSGEDEIVPVDGSVTLKSLISLLCERECLRQRLPINATEQIKAFQSLVVEGARGAPLETQVVEIAVSEARPELDDLEVRETVKKLKHHPLIDGTRADGWEWQEEQVEVLLLAEYLCQLSDDGAEKEIHRFCSGISWSESKRMDLADAVVGVALREKRWKDAQLGKMVLSFIDSSEARGGPCANREGSKLGVAIALRAMDRTTPTGATRTDRKQMLAAYCGDLGFSHLDVGGQVTSMDFRGSLFTRCSFDRVVWANCSFDDETIFDKCRFVGGDAHNCTGFGRSQIRDPELDRVASEWIDREMVSVGTRQYGRDHLRGDIKVVLNKFVGKGGVGMRTVEARNLDRGAIRKSRHGEEVIEELGREVLERHEISGRTSTGFNVRKEAVSSIRFYADNNVFIGPVERAYERLAKKLGVK